MDFKEIYSFVNYFNLDKEKKIEDYCFSVVHCCFAFGNILWLYILLLMLPSLNIFSSSFIAYKKYGFILSKIFKIRLDYDVIK